MNRLNSCAVFLLVFIFEFLESSYAIYVPNEHESKPSYTSMVKIPLYIKNPSSLQYYQNYSKVLFHNSQNKALNNNSSKYNDSTKTTRLFPVYNTYQDPVNIKKDDENLSGHPVGSTMVSQKVSKSGAVAEETLNQRVVYKRRIEKGKQIEVYHKCPSGVTGQFVYDLSCNQFLDCWKGRGGPRNCAPGTLFNPKNLQCDFPDKVECITGPRQNTISSSSQRSQNLQIEQVTCPDGFSGLIPNYTDCTKFIRCNNGQQNSLDCPPDTLFDFTHNICDFPYKSICFSNYSSNYAIEQNYNNQQSQYINNNCKPHDRNCYAEYRTPYGYSHTQQENSQNTYSPHGTYHQTSWQRGSGYQNCDPKFGNCQVGTGIISQDGYHTFAGQASGGSRTAGTINSNQWENRGYQACNPQKQDCSLNSGSSTQGQTFGTITQTGTVLCNPKIHYCGQSNTYSSGGSSYQSGSQPCNSQTQNCEGSSTFSNDGNIRTQPCNAQTQNCAQTNTYSGGGRVDIQPCNPQFQNCGGTNTYSNGGRIDTQPCNPQTQNCGASHSSGVHSQNVGSHTGVYSSGSQSQQSGGGYHTSTGQTQQFGGRGYTSNAGATGSTIDHTQQFGSAVYPSSSSHTQQFDLGVHSNTGSHTQHFGRVYPGNSVQTQQSGAGMYSSSGSHTQQFGEGGQYQSNDCNPLTQNCEQNIGYPQTSNALGFGYGNSQNSGSRTFGGTESGTIGYGGHTQNHGETNNQNYDGVNYGTVCNINDRICQQRTNNTRYASNRTSGSPKCPDGFQGITKHPTICKKFLNCANGITYVQDCAEGTLFNPLSGICDFPYNVDCDNTGETTTTNYNEGTIGINSNFYGYPTSTTPRNQNSYYRPGQDTPSTPTYKNNGYFNQPTISTCTGRGCDTQISYGQTSGTDKPEYHSNNQYPGNIPPTSVHVQSSGTYGTNQEQDYSNNNQYQSSRHSNSNQYSGPYYQQSTTSSTTQRTRTESHIYRVPTKNKAQNNFEHVPDYVDVFDPSDNQKLYARSTSTTQKPQKFVSAAWPPPYPSTDTNADYVFEYEDGEPITLESENENVYVEKRGNQECRTGDFYCNNKICLPKTARCNGIKECPNGKDEVDCQETVELFEVHTNSRLEVLEKQRWDNVSYVTCAVLCLETKKFGCKSFNYRKIDKTCFLTDKNIGLSGGLKTYYPFDYYELKNGSMDCSQMHVCPNGKCLTSDQVCNGINDCGDRADEKGCRASDFGYNVKLAGGNKRSEGRIEVTVFGQTGYICDDQFDLKDANIACKELGYQLGAIEIRGNSYFAKDIKEKNTLYMMDDIECVGNETSLLECNFAGWGIHNCKDQEIVGVVCRTPEEKCGKNYWKCDTSNECVPIDFVCDELYDCADNSDEANHHCEAPTELRLMNGSNFNEGRIEIKHHGIWGTVCDDDFNDDAAKVVCKHLGYVGVSKVQKDGYYGAGEGPIWLDQVSCFGNETNLEDCTHWKWGEHNCDHSEDVGVICSNDVNEVEVQRHSKAVEANSGSFGNRHGETIEPVSCGYRKDNIFLQDDEVHFRVVQGSVAKKGDYPWQAAIRVKRQEKSAHWCGAVVISSKWVLTAAHCLDGYPKGAYILVAGEYNTDENEGTEQQAYIEEYYLHSNFREGHKMANDIALIKLKGHGFRLNQDIQPICLPDINTDYENDLNCTISGFGSIQSGSAVYSHSLRAAWIPIQKMDVCKMAHIYGKSITEGMICAGYLDGGVDACDGDSGGPLACLNNGVFTLYGLTSWGQRCGIANKPGVYVKIAYYRPWIDKIIKTHS